MPRYSMLDLLAMNPRGLGPSLPGPEPEVAYQDDAGNSYGFDGSILDRWRTPQDAPQQTPSLMDSLLNIAESPAKLAVGMVQEPYNALARLGDNFVTEDGSLGLPNPQNPENQTDMATLLLTGFGSNAFRGGRPGVVSSGPVAGAGEQAKPIRAYRGTAGEQFNHRDGRVWMTDEPDVASNYALAGGVDQHVDAPASVYPLDVSFQNPMRYDAQGASYTKLVPPESGWPDTIGIDLLGAIAKRRGHDGLIVENVVDPVNGYVASRPATTYAAFSPGTVRSATTGEVLFSDTGRPSLLGATLAAEQASAKQQRKFLNEVTGSADWYHAAQPGFEKFNDPTDYLGVHLTRHKNTALDYQADRGGPLLRIGQPFAQPFTLPPKGGAGYDEALAEAQKLLPGFDGTKASLERNAASYRDILRREGYDAIASQDHVLLDDAFEAIALDPKFLNALIYSDTGKPSLLGSAMAAENDPYPPWYNNAFLTY